MSNLTFDNFSYVNRKRSAEDFAHDPHDYPVILLALKVSAEVGELVQAIAKHEDFISASEWDEHEQRYDLLQKQITSEIGDVIAFLDLIAERYARGTLGDIVAQKFNAVSDRIGSDIKIPVHA